MAGDRLGRAQAVGTGSFVGVAWLVVGILATGSILQGAAVGGVTAVVAVVAGVVADHRPVEDRRIAVGAWVLVAALAGGGAFSLSRWAGVPAAPGTALAAGVAIGVAAAATAAVAGDVLATAARDRLSEATRERLGRAGEVLVRVPGFDLVRIVRAFEDDDNADTVRVLAMLVVPFGLAYATFPLDLVPDVLVPIGWIDDVTVYVVLREVVFTGHDHETGVRGASKVVIASRLKRLSLGLLVAVAVVVGTGLAVAVLVL